MIESNPTVTSLCLLKAFIQMLRENQFLKMNETVETAHCSFSVSIENWKGCPGKWTLPAKLKSVVTYFHLLNICWDPVLHCKEPTL